MVRISLAKCRPGIFTRSTASTRSSGVSTRAAGQIRLLDLDGCLDAVESPKHSCLAAMPSKACALAPLAAGRRGSQCAAQHPGRLKKKGKKEKEKERKKKKKKKYQRFFLFEQRKLGLFQVDHQILAYQFGPAAFPSGFAVRQSLPYGCESCPGVVTASPLLECNAPSSSRAHA
jgi:hypothetical protein